MKIKVGDTIVFIATKERHKKDKTGKVVKVVKNANKIIIEGHNMRTKHIKKTDTKPGQKITFEAPVDVSNVMVVCPKCTKATRVGYTKLQDGKKQRICKKCSESLDTAKATVKVKSKAK